MNTESLRLTVVNDSSDANNSTILIFQQNVTPSQGERAIAWQVIKNLGRTWRHSFDYDFELEVGAMDSYGNRSPALSAAPGDLFSIYKDNSGDQLRAIGNVPNGSTEIWVRNDLGLGASNACVYRGGQLLANKTSIAPGQMASFQFNPSISIGVLSQRNVSAGQPLSSAILSAVNTQVSLAGLTGSADIVITGGGPGRTSTPFTFTLQPTG
jgi:hypothetical protein